MHPLLEIPITVGRDAAREEAQRELAKGKYRPEVPQFLVDAFERWQRLVNSIADLLFGKTPVGAPPETARLSIALVVVVLLALVGLLLWRFGLPRRSARLHDGSVDADADVLPEDYRSLAEQAAAAGDWRTAVQEAFRAMVRELEVRTVLEHRPARTAFETAALIARTWPELDPQLYAAATTFNEVVYGHRAAVPGDYATVRQAEDLVVARADAGWVEAP